MKTKQQQPIALPLLLAALLVACNGPAPTNDEATGAATTTTATAAAITSRTAPRDSTTAAADAGSEHTKAEPAPPPGRSAEAFRALMKELSEPDADFFSNNYISNETSYLQIARQLSETASPGGAYIGAGPEQNFTYIALTEPQYAYIVDIRRDNLVLQLLYKALFDEATTRAHFLALLTARPFDEAAPDPPTATLEQVMAVAERREPSEDSFKSIHARVRHRIEQTYGISLSDKDRVSLKRAHYAFYKDGLDIRFSLREKSFRKYPSLREILAATDPQGHQLGFLVREQSFRLLQRMQRQNRILPLVGDFGGQHTLQRLAGHLQEQDLTVSVFYVSNVEQYLLVYGKWGQWRKNIAALPRDDKSLFLRCYLDQGKPHPRQLAGHRTTTTLHLMKDFIARKKPYPSMLALASADLLPLPR